MSDQRAKDGKFFMWYGLIEGSAMVLAILAWYFWHENITLLIGSVVLIAMVGSSFLLAHVLTRNNTQPKD